MTRRVLITDSIDPSGEALLAAHGAEPVRSPDGAPDTVRRLAAGCDALIIRSRMPDDIFDSAPRLRAVTIHGTGTDLVPMDSANRHGVAVANLPGVNAQSVAEYCAMAMLMLARKALQVTAAMRTQNWDEARSLGAEVFELAGMTAGIVGVGEIGRRTAKILRDGFGMTVLGNQRRLDALPEGVAPAALDELVAESDFIIVTAPLTPETRHLFDAARIARMKPTAWLVNVGRGPVIDEAALIDALRARRIAGAMLDVYEQYRIGPEHELFRLDNVILTPHLAGMTRQSRARAAVVAARETLRMLEGERPTHFVNPDCWSRFRERRPQNR